MEKPELSKSLAPFFEKIEKLTKIQRILIFSGVLIFAVGIFVYMIWLPKLDEIKKLESEYTKLSKKLDVAVKTSKTLPAFKDKMRKADTQLKVIMKALPETKEIPTLLESISTCGQDAGLEFVLFQPRGERNRNFYAEIPVSIQVIGNYHNVAIFFDKVARLPRIVNIDNIKMKVQNKKNNKLYTSCTALTYKFLEAKSSGKAKKKGRSKRRGRR